ncbi:response regulator [Aliikangiella sp. G2MR2-5]|uniref:response regulator n=1 Tax=Aliikangiella sp. G2MR2-5 TaxID=2788943 RepID=UPI0018ABA7A0|nr:response regulator [Aliikangiella sp. G2MR2-5]
MSEVVSSEKILVAEDDFANQRVATLFLKKLGYQVDIAENGQTAVSLASENTYALILMDCQMPVMDGFEATRKIRVEQGPNQQVPIIALTANVVCGINGECEKAGMNDILNKPVQLEQMKSMLERWISSQAH